MFVIPLATYETLQFSHFSMGNVFNLVKTGQSNNKSNHRKLSVFITNLAHKTQDGEVTNSINAKRQAVKIACPHFAFALSSEYLAHIQINFMGVDSANSQPSQQALRRGNAKSASTNGLTQPKAQKDYSIFQRPMLSREAEQAKSKFWGLSSGVFCSGQTGQNIG